jgi:hypothetical protein
MSDIDRIARAIYEARFPDAGKLYGEPAWDDQTEAVKDVWRRCAAAALRCCPAQP